MPPQFFRNSLKTIQDTVTDNSKHMYQLSEMLLAQRKDLNDLHLSHQTTLNQLKQINNGANEKHQ